MAGVLADDLGGLEQGGAHIGQVLVRMVSALLMRPPDLVTT